MSNALGYIKIKKKERQVSGVKDEVVYYGVIDKESVFATSGDRKEWTNGTETYPADEFELYLKKI